jgi:hypothetical protein
MRNVLFIGGSYFVGRVFVEEMADVSGFSLFVLNRGSRPLNIEGVIEIQCDRHRIEEMGDLIPSLNWDAVVDFCAYEPGDIVGLLKEGES